MNTNSKSIRIKTNGIILLNLKIKYSQVKSILQCNCVEHNFIHSNLINICELKLKLLAK